MRYQLKSAAATIAVLFLPFVVSAQIGGSGWTSKAVTFNVQWPYNVPQNTRYFATNNMYHCLVYSNDVPFKTNTTTLPRTEQRFTPDYTTGEIQYQASLMAVSNENSYCVFQIHTGDAQSTNFGSTTFMLFWFMSDGGSVHDYSGTELAKNLANQWFQLNVDHNLVTRTIKVWVNQKLVWTQQDNGAGDFYFKDGVYEQSHSPTLQMDTYITNILMWTSSGTNPPAAPTGLSATPTTSQISLAWNPSVDATNYNVKRSTTSGNSYTNIGSTSGTNYNDTTAATGTIYYYVVTALDSFGESAKSAQVSAVRTNAIVTDFRLSAAPPLVSMPMGFSTNFTVSITPSNGFSGSVALSLDGLPPGASGSFNPPTLSAAGSSTLTIQTAATNSPGNYALAINGTNGASGHTYLVTINIVPPQPAIANSVVSGNNLILSGGGGAAKGTYYVLSSTNLSLPRAQWTRIATNQFDAAGGFVATNTIDPNEPPRFYLLEAE